MIAALVTGALALGSTVAGAQQTQLDVHGNLAIGTSSHNKSWGGGAGVQVTVGNGPIKVSLAPSLDYLKQEKSGPSQTSLALSQSTPFQ